MTARRVRRDHARLAKRRAFTRHSREDSDAYLRRHSRHSSASHLLRAGVDLNTIRAWLGHVSINTTNIYAEIDLDTKARALAACVPTTHRARGTFWRNQPTLMEFLRAL